MALEKGLSEGVWEEDVVYRVCYHTVGLKFLHVEYVQESMKISWRGQQNDEYVNCDCCEDYLMVCWCEMAPTVHLPVCVELICNNRTESCRILQMRRNFTEDSRETRVIMQHVILVERVLF